MTEQQARELAQLINGTLAETINTVVKKRLGIDAQFLATAHSSFYSGWYVKTKQTNTDETTKALTKSKLLRAMFESGELELKSYRSDDENTVHFSVLIGYSHPQGGSNGLSDLLVFSINTNTLKVRVQK